MTKTNNANKTDKKKLGIYIHIPFCVKKCRYCDFLSYTTHTAEVQKYYTTKLIEEIIGESSVYSNKYIVDTIYLGGGTPTLLRIKNIEDILDAVYSRFKIMEDAEITIEANPGAIDLHNLRTYINMGINRLSIGAQSFEKSILKYLGRIHDAETIMANYKEIRKAGFDNVSMDMMFGIPGQTAEMWHSDIKKVIDLKPEHISFYSLQIEENTEVFADVIEKRVDEPDPLLDRDMYHDAIKQLKSNGYNHYEISNATISGYESKHNLKYWSMEDYLGVGLGACSFMENKRFGNTENFKKYLSENHRSNNRASKQEISKADHMSEYIFLGLRKTKGIDLADFEKRYGKKLLDLYRTETENLIERGLLEIKKGNLKLTLLGLDLSNIVFREYV